MTDSFHYRDILFARHVTYASFGSTEVILTGSPRASLSLTTTATLTVFMEDAPTITVAGKSMTLIDIADTFDLSL